MHATFTLVLVGSVAFVGTMIDNLFAFAAQLTLTPRDRFAAVTVAQSSAVVCLVVLAGAVGSSLTVIPVRWVGVLALAPWLLALRSWRHRRDPLDESARRGNITTFLVTVGLGGDNLAVWIPLLRANGLVHEVALGVIFALWQMVFVLAAWALATHPRVVSWGRRGGRLFIPWLYGGLGIVILVECHVL